MSAKSFRKTCVIVGVGALALSLALTKGLAFPLEFLNASCVTWDSCTDCVEGFGTSIGQPSDTCFAAVGGFGDGSAQHCVNDGSATGNECIYKTTADPGQLTCFGAAVYLCDHDGQVCVCECSGSADLSGVNISDTTICITQ